MFYLPTFFLLHWLPSSSISDPTVMSEGTPGFDGSPCTPHCLSLSLSLFPPYLWLLHRFVTWPLTEDKYAHMAKKKMRQNMSRDKKKTCVWGAHTRAHTRTYSALKCAKSNLTKSLFWRHGVEEANTDDHHLHTHTHITYIHMCQHILART